MRTGAAAGHIGYFHEAAVYESDEQFLDLVVPHLQASVAAGEPTFASLLEREAALVRRAMGDRDGVTFLPARVGERPPITMERMSSLLAGLAAGGVEQVRLVSAVPHPGVRAPWDGWCRYEAAVNDLLIHLPAWELCLFDRRVTSGAVLDDVERVHPHLGTADGRHLANPRYEEPQTFLRSMAPPPPDPLEAGPPVVALADPTAAVARQALRAAADATRVTGDEIDELIVATSETVTNALRHGRPPVDLKVWTAPDRVLVTVHDRGPGPLDPYVGLVPRPSAVDGQGGYGLWIAHQLVAATHRRTPDGFTIVLVAGRPVA